jgi:hypothetical protein
VETVEQAPIQAEPVAPEPVARRSTRIKTQARAYAPSLSGTGYSYAVTQLESHGVLNPDAHMFVQEDFYQAEPDVVAAVMTQLSLKSGCGRCGSKSCPTNC